MADENKHITVGEAKMNIGLPAALEMIDTFDRPPNAFATDTYAEAGSYAEGFEDKPGKRLPKAGLSAAAGVGLARAEYSVFDAEAKGPNASAGIGASTAALGAGAFARAEIGSASVTAGPLKAKVGLAADTGISVGATGLEVKVLGTGINIGPRPSVSFFGSEVQCTLS